MNQPTQLIKTLLRAASLIVVSLVVVSASAFSQTRKSNATKVQLGNQLTTIPAPVGFEEAASQFENIKSYFTSSEVPGNDVLAVHMPQADCQKLRAGGFGPFNFYTKISIRKGNRERDYSAENFADLVAEFRKSGAKYLDVNSPQMKAAIDRLRKGASELNQEETQIDFSQPVNLGEFDTGPNVYSAMLLLNIKTQSADGELSVPILGGLSYVRVGQRLVYVYTYRKFESQNDVATLRDFTKRWIGQILAANRPPRSKTRKA
ncbi:MAG TPA: hypothetical protein VGO56_06250 [Pyrinomonadaceae bacterium]|jgi:hypothetical protein|nr:hypothetical protein [Pyrinomonadaceae bacterium]